MESLAYPGKKLFGKNNEGFVEKRGEELVHFWNAYFKVTALLTRNRTWKYFDSVCVKETDSFKGMFYNALSCIKSVLGYDKKRSVEEKVDMNLKLIKEEKMKEGSNP
jgi:hypothetical protein